ncbi:PhnD/SsuA/transferrin family substrate-binding protein [Thermosulfurimonas marina]|uniref:histidine kinase n=1 Tax=Thermosulfurimonas marina TaxID=2047767 RepID=A0A6H1WSY4_9BACT|nr:PhnD/SsuA/transferrin family substrate-binding protein [Thermosulfurimonas marina]QJA06236.1 PhnD/SsuA/transferrin family substrate-binding protein [Thermosulfurimonas marina]
MFLLVRLVLLAVFFSSALPTLTPAASNQEVVFAVLAKRGPEIARRRWQPLVDYLERRTGLKIKLLPLPFRELEEAVEGQKVDLVLANSGMYVLFESCCGVTPLVTLKNLKLGQVYSRFGGVLFTRADRRDIRSLKDLRHQRHPPAKGALIGAVDPESFGGWIMQWRLLRRAGLRRGKDYTVRFYGTHDAVVLAVLRGEVDAGCVRTDTLESMAAEGRIRLADFRVLHPVKHPGFAFLVSTELYPEWPLARTPRLADEKAETLAAALLALPKDSPVARAAEAAWTLPLNYQPVHEAFKELGLGPYAEVRARALKEARKRYLHIIFLYTLISLIGLFLTLYIFYLNRRLTKLNRSLDEYRHHLEEMVAERTANLEALAETLREERERLAVILRSLGEAVIVTDTWGRITLVNPAAEKLLGRRSKELVGRSFCEALSLEIDGRPCGEALLLLQEDRLVEIAEARLRLPQGEERVVEGTAAPVHGEGSQILGTVVILRDISLRKRLEEEARRASQLEVLSLLAAGLAHDFNNLLATIMGYLDVLRLRVSDPEIQEVAERAEKACLSARTLTRELLTYTKGGGPVKRLARLEEVIREALAFGLAGSGVQAELNLEPDLPPVEMDLEQMAICLHNLLLNARQAMGEWGRIFLRARKVELPPGDPSGLPPGPYVALEIRDTGPGIPEEDLPRIFEPFFTTKPGGSGLGLFTCRRVIEAHGGRILAENAPEGGALFRIYLPAAEGQVLPAEERPRPAIPRRARVLVLDDEEGVRETVAELLRLQGFEVETASEGGEALKAFEEALSAGRPFEVVLLDLTVPGGLGGKEVLPEMRRRDPEVKAIVMSGYSQDPVLSNFRDFGFDGAMVKPFSAQDLLRVMAEVLGPTGED